MWRSALPFAPAASAPQAAVRAVSDLGLDPGGQDLDLLAGAAAPSIDLDIQGALSECPRSRHSVAVRPITRAAASAAQRIAPGPGSWSVAFHAVPGAATFHVTSNRFRT